MAQLRASRTWLMSAKPGGGATTTIALSTLVQVCQNGSLPSTSSGAISSAVSNVDQSRVQCSEFEGAARALLVLIEHGRTVLDRHENAQALLESFRDKCDTFVPSSPLDMFSDTQV